MGVQLQIDKDLFTQQIKEGFTIKQLQEYWKCGRTAIMDRKKEWGLIGMSPNSKKRDNGDGNKTCISCGVTKSVSEFYSNGTTPKGSKKLKSNCISCENAKRKEIFLLKIIEILQEQGRKYLCELCGYDENFSALCFHHTDEKNFEISKRRNASYSELSHEISICKVLCHNCHTAIHNPMLDKSLVFGGALVSTE